MGLLSWLLGRRRVPSPDDPQAEVEAESGLAPLEPTPTMRPLATPKPTPTTRPLAGARPTAGIPTYGAPHGTPSTRRIHNPNHPGR